MGLILMLVLIILAIGSLPIWPHARSRGYWPSSIAVLLFVTLIMFIYFRVMALV